MASTTIYLARHGSHDELGRVLSGRSEIALNDEGRAEAARLAGALAALPLKSIHSSPRRRARETADPIARAQARMVRIAPALDEIDFGSWSGRAFLDLDRDARWADWNARRWRTETPAGETMAAACDRAAGYIEAIDDGPALCVSHCDVIRGLVARYRGVAEADFFSIAVDPGSLTRLDRVDGAVEVVSVNERPA